MTVWKTICSTNPTTLPWPSLIPPLWAGGLPFPGQAPYDLSHNFHSLLVLSSHLYQSISRQNVNRSQCPLKYRPRLFPALKPLFSYPKYLSLPAIRIIGCIVGVNVLVWIAIVVVLRYHPLLLFSTILLYTFSLRHALNTNHISVINFITQCLIASGLRFVTIKMWFSLGYSTIIIITCIVVAATSGALEKHFDGFKRIGNIVGTIISTSVLILLGLANTWILYKLVRRLRWILREKIEENTVISDGGFKIKGEKFLVRILNKILQIINRP